MNAERQLSGTFSVETPSNNEKERLEEPKNTTTGEKEDASDHGDSEEFIMDRKITEKINRS